MSVEHVPLGNHFCEQFSSEELGQMAFMSVLKEWSDVMRLYKSIKVVDENS